MTLLLDKGADLNVQDHQGKTALMLASQAGQSVTVKALLDKGAEADIKDQDDETALSYVRAAQKPDIEAMLRKVGARPAKEAPNKQASASAPKPEPKPKPASKAQ